MTNNGLEYCSSQFIQLCEETGISRHKTIRGTQQQNALGEDEQNHFGEGKVDVAKLD